ncbi:MAG: hypothetical protein HY897_15900 [Deltaproteobacteria bacterium]|nr:hypothetical protein [Deltaproteobacteria bacterium]
MRQQAKGGRRTVTTFIVAWCLAASVAGAAEKAREPAVLFHGNVVFLEPVLLGQMGIDGAAVPSAREMAAGIERLYAFYRKSGYVLVDMHYRKRGPTWHVFIDEGKLDRIIIIGTGSIRTVLIRQSIHLPYKVFNKAQIEKDIEAIKKKHGIPRIDYKVVELEEVAHEGFQIPEWLTATGHDILPPALSFEPRARYDLRIHVRSSEWGTGFGWGLDYTSLGISAHADYSGESALFEKDRQRLLVAAGGDRRSRIDDGNDYLTFAQGTVEVEYFLPPIAKTRIRPQLVSRSDIANWQRKDLPLELYWFFKEELSANAQFEPFTSFTLSLGAGSQFNNLFGLETVESRPMEAPVAEGPFQRWFVAGTVEYQFDELMLRKDQRHSVFGKASHYFGGSRNTTGAFEIEYQKVFLFGYDDLTLKTAGLYMWGDPVFHEEYRLTWGPFSSSFDNMFYVRRAAYQAADYGMSLYHEVVTLHVFCDLAAFGRISRKDNSEELAGALSAGPGLSLLLYDTFMFRLHYAYGRATTGDSGWELGMSFRKVF